MRLNGKVARHGEGVLEVAAEQVYADCPKYIQRRVPGPRISDGVRPGVVVAPSVWWKKYAPDGRNANNVTSQSTTDLGGGATI